MHARLVATLMCLCGPVLSAPAGSAPNTRQVPVPPTAQAGAAREAQRPAVQPPRDHEDARRPPAPAPAPAQASQRERGLMLAGLALMIGIALRRLGAGGP
ncbi:MAG: hypothetical protein RIS88_980 [Pseudomonadota bacterium]|jgi:hypothetical protein